MRKSTMQVILTTSILIFSSLAGCLGTEDDDDDKVTIMTSTYHVGQLVSAIVGDTMNVEVLSPSNVPVHDYEPSATDLVRLTESDMFFYHGLGLETWVDATLDSLGDDKPTSFSTHALPTGETALDYEGILLRELCEHMGEGPYEASYLSEEEGHADDVELHAEHVTHVLKFPGHDDHDHADDDHADDDHDDHDHADDHADDDPDDHEHADDEESDDDHDDHDHADDDHDDHSDRDDHDGHNHAEPMEKMEEVTGCPEDTVVYIYELEEGEYVLEFEIEDEDHSTFDMVVLKMGGAHAHHDHGDHGDEHDDDHSDHGDDHDDHESEMVCYDMSTHTVDMTLTTQTDCEAAGLMWTESRGDSDHDDHHDEMTPEMALERFDTNNDSMLSWDEFREGFFEDDDEHDDEEHDELEEAMEEYLADMMSTLFNESDTNSDALLNVSELYIFMESMEEAEDQLDTAGSQMMISMFDEDDDGQLSVDEFTNLMDMMSMEGDGGDTNATEMAELMFSMFDTDSNGFVNMSELGMLMDMGDEEEDLKGYATIHIEAEGEYGFAISHDVEMFILTEGGGHDDHSDHDDHDDHDDHSDHDDHGDEEALAYDPHSWLDPVAFKAQASFVLEELKKAYPDLADTFQSNADAFMMSLDKIDSEYKAAFGDGGTCAKKSVASNHNAYAYIAYRYDIEFVTVHGVDPEGEPSAADITKVVEKIGNDEITVLFVEEFTAEAAVNSIIEQTKSSTMPDGVSVLTLYTMELPPKDSNDDYLSLMQKNLDNLKTGLSC